MAIKVNIRKILSVTMWSIVGAGVSVLLVAAIGYRNNKTCKGYRIDIAGPALPAGKEGAVSLFIGKKEILEILGAGGAGKWQGRTTASFDLRRMETVLEKNVWISDAQLFFDNNGILRVNVMERTPVARVFTEDGNSCYIDSSGVQLPLSDKLSARLPVFTGYPGRTIKLHGPDSLLTVQVRQLGDFIQKDPFWMAQINQISIRSDRNFELVPTIGNHLIEFGDGSDYRQKFHRLMVFYKEVLTHTGFDKYSKIDIGYAGQVIGTKKGSEGSRQDSLQGMKNIEQLIRTAQHLQPDTVRLAEMRPLEKPVMTEQSLTSYDLIPDHRDNEGAKEHNGTTGNNGAATGAKAIMPKKPVKNNYK